MLTRKFCRFCKKKINRSIDHYTNDIKNNDKICNYDCEYNRTINPDDLYKYGLHDGNVYIRTNGWNKMVYLRDIYQYLDNYFQKNDLDEMKEKIKKEYSHSNVYQQDVKNLQKDLEKKYNKKNEYSKESFPKNLKKKWKIIKR